MTKLEELKAELVTTYNAYVAAGDVTATDEAAAAWGAYYDELMKQQETTND
jgi:hypothetical protein